MPIKDLVAGYTPAELAAAGITPEQMARNGMTRAKLLPVAYIPLNS